MTAAEAVRTCLGKYATFRGRAGRAEFWWFMAALLLAQILATGVDAALFGAGEAGPEGEPAAGGPTSALLALATVVPSLAAGWRRMHDVGRPGWHSVLHHLVAFGTLAVTGLIALVTGLAWLPGPGAGGLAGGGAPGLGFVVVMAPLVAFGLVVWWLAGEGEAGPNAYGEEPAR